MSLSAGSRSHAPRPRPVVVVAGGGKGGVGKTFVVANLATCLARAGHSVIAVDADLEGANLHTCLGVSAPRASLADFVAHREEDLEKLLIDTPVPKLRLIAGTQANLASAQPGHFRRERLIHAVARLPVDYVFIDLGAGMHAATIDYFLAGDEGIVVTSPEPTSVENAYGFLRAAFYRRMRGALRSPEVRRLVGAAMDQRNERGIRTPLDLLREVQALDADEGVRFVDAMRAFHPRFVVNGVRNADDVKLGFAVRSVCKKYFGIEADYLGYVNHDDAVRRSVVARKPVVLAQPESDAALYLTRIARKLDARRRGLAIDAAPHHHHRA
jgi:flagellar biosynthesis protein FlhG